MTNEELVALNNVLNEIKDLKGENVKFAYGIAKNKKIVGSEVEVLRQALKQVDHPEFQKYQDERRQVGRKYCIKDATGEPITMGDTFEIPRENIPAYTKELTRIDENFKGVVDAINEINEENNKLMKEEAKVDPLFKVNLTLFPKDITPAQMEGLMPIIKDEEETPEPEAKE